VGELYCYLKNGADLFFNERNEIRFAKLKKMILLNMGEIRGNDANKISPHNGRFRTS
jgi:hypothetical protein